MHGGADTGDTGADDDDVEVVHSISLDTLRFRRLVRAGGKPERYQNREATIGWRGFKSGILAASRRWCTLPP
jgi:hypothetical protein